jgi:hypothetical protein
MMDATRTSAAEDAAAAGRTGEPERPAAERARARAYLDLWERNLVQAALHGPAPRPRSGETGGRARPPA